MPHTPEELSKEALQPTIDEIKNTPVKIFDYIDDIQMFDRLIQLLFNQSQLGLIIGRLENDSGENDLQKLYDIAYKYIPRKMDNKASEEAIKKTSEKTIQRLIKSKSNSYYSNLTKVRDIITNRIELYPVETYSQDTLESLIVESYYSLPVIEKLYPMLDDDHSKNVSTSIGLSFIENPHLFKYVEQQTLDDELLIAIIGAAIRNNKLEEVEHILEEKNIPQKLIKNIENLFFSDYNEFELDKEIEFDD